MASITLESASLCRNWRSANCSPSPSPNPAESTSIFRASASPKNDIRLRSISSNPLSRAPLVKCPAPFFHGEKRYLFSPKAVSSSPGESPAMVAKEMERVAAKEALILAAKDAGGVESLSSGEGNSASKIEVSEKVLGLERLNPTPRPTTSPLLEGVWEFVWAGSRSPALTAARILLKRFPEQVAKIESLNLEILQGGSRATASVKLLSSVETSFTLSTRLAVEGPLRLKEEYVEGVLSTPNVAEANIPDPLKSVATQLQSLSSNLPESIKDAIANGLKLPLSGTFDRELLVSYLDDEILVVRDQYGLPDVLVRAVAPAPELGVEDPYDVQMPE